MTGLEPATAWSQTRNATNCATPRLPKSGCKGTKKKEKGKVNSEKFATAQHILTKVMSHILKKATPSGLPFLLSEYE